MLRRLRKKEALTPAEAIPTPPTEAEEKDDDMGLFDREQTTDPVKRSPVEPPADMDSSRKYEDGLAMETSKHSETPVTAPERRDSNLSVIGKSLFVKGEMEAAEDMVIEGRVEGSIKHTASQLTVGGTGVVNADINAKNLVIEGTVEGNIVGSESVVIRDSAEVRGNIYTARISIADGAQFSGTVDMDMSRSPKH